MVANAITISHTLSLSKPQELLHLKSSNSSLQITSRGSEISSKKTEMNSKPSFFKFVSSSEKMGFPRGTAARIRGIRCGVAVLMDKGHHAWEVGVESDGDDFSFKKGWPQFYRENRLEYGDCVVFTYHGNNLFHFQLFGRNGLEKKTTRGPVICVEEEVGEFSDDDDDDDVVELVVESEEERRVPCRRKCSRNVSSIHTSAGRKGLKAPIYRVDEDEDDEESTNSDESDDEESTSDESDCIEMEMEEGDYEEEETTSIGKTEQKPRLLSLGGRRAYKKQNVPDCYGHDIFKSGLAMKPKNPYFVSRSRKPRKNELYIPRDVIVDFRLEIPTTLFLVDGTGKKWKAKMKKWKDGRVWCTRGWKSLCSVNNIGLDDTCICEFVQQGQGSLCLHIRVVDGAPHAGSK